MFDGKRMDVGDRSIAAQAGRDVKIGLSYTEVKDMVYLLFKANFPELLAEAMQKVEERLDIFSKYLEKSFEKVKEEIDVGKFSEPFVQFQLQEMAKTAAKKGEKGNMELLCDAFSLCLTKKSPEIMELIASEALKLIPDLSRKHVGYLTFLTFINEADYNTTDLTKINTNLKEVFSYFYNVEEVSNSDLMYLSYKGAIQKKGLRHTGIIPLCIRNHPEFKEKKREEVLSILRERNLLEIEKIVILTEERYVGVFDISATGRLIGWLSLSPIADVDYEKIF